MRVSENELMSTRVNSKVTEISQAELSRRHGWSRSYTSKLVGEGKISILPNGKIDPVQAEKELEMNTGWTMHGKRGHSLGDEDDRILDLKALSQEQRRELCQRVMKQFCDAANVIWAVMSEGTPVGSPPSHSKGRATQGWWTRALMLELVDKVCRTRGC